MLPAGTRYDGLLASHTATVGPPRPAEAPRFPARTLESTPLVTESGDFLTESGVFPADPDDFVTCVDIFLVGVHRPAHFTAPRVGAIGTGVLATA